MFKSFCASSAFFMGFVVLAFAEGPSVPAGTAGAPGAPAQPGFMSMIFPFVMMFGVIYFLMIRPQQKRMKEQQALLSSLKQGDEVLTTSGMLGKISGIEDKVVTVEVADKVHVRMMKSQVTQVVKGPLKDISV